jgi:hypothetical protein
MLHWCILSQENNTSKSLTISFVFLVIEPVLLLLEMRLLKTLDLGSGLTQLAT